MGETPRWRRKLSWRVRTLTDAAAASIGTVVTGTPVLNRGLSRSVDQNQLKSFFMAMGLVLVIVLYLYRCLEAFAYPKWGLVLTAPFRVRLWPGKFREPDVNEADTIGRNHRQIR